MVAPSAATGLSLFMRWAPFARREEAQCRRTWRQDVGRDSDVQSRCGVDSASPVADDTCRSALGRARHRAPDTSFSGARVPALAALLGPAGGGSRASSTMWISLGAAWGAAHGEQICRQHNSGVARSRETACSRAWVANPRLLRTLSPIWGGAGNARMPDAPGELLRDT